MPKVYISAYSTLNYEFLDPFGEVVKEPFTVGFVELSDLQHFYKRIKPVLDKTQPDDYLALSGATAVSVVISQLWLQKHGIVRLLSFDKKKGPSGGYREIILTNTSLIPDDGPQKDNS